MSTNESTKPIFYENRKFLPNEFAKYLLNGSGEHFITPRDTEVIHRYDTGVYLPDGTTYIKELVENVVDGKNISSRTANEVLGHIQRRTYINRDEFDSNIDEITLKNGVLNTKTFDFRDHNPKKHSLLRIPVNYVPDADCPLFKKFLVEILPNKIERETIIELFGYCLVRNYSIQKWFMFLGEGANGKGTLLSTLRTFLGVNNISAVELQDFDKPFSIAELYGRLANIVGDLSAKELYHSGRLKSLTGGDLLLAEKKFQNPFNFVNHAKLIYSANDLPKTFDGTRAFWRRVMLINFNETFSGKADVKDLWKAFTTDAEMSGILNLAIEGLHRLNDNQQFTKNNSADEVADHYIRNSDPVAAFFIDCVEITNNVNDYISLQSLHAAFVEYCKQYQFRDNSLRKFNSTVRKDFRLQESRKDNEVTGKQDRVWNGVFLSYEKDDIILPSSSDVQTEMTEMTEHSINNSVRNVKVYNRETSHSGHSVIGLNTMEFIQKKISEYGNAENHTYNVIEALLEKTDTPIDEIGYCIKLHKQGHRVYIPRKE